MKRVMRALLLGPMLAWASAAQAHGIDAFCAELRRIVFSAAQRQPFSGLAEGGAGDALGFDRCRLDGEGWGRRFSCIAYGPRRAPALAERTAQCLPGAIAMAEPAGSSLTRYRTGMVAIHIRFLTRPEGGPAIRYSIFAVPVHSR